VGSEVIFSPHAPFWGMPVMWTRLGPLSLSLPGPDLFFISNIFQEFRHYIGSYSTFSPHQANLATCTQCHTFFPFLLLRDTLPPITLSGFDAEDDPMHPDPNAVLPYMSAR
jgi:hypothetical protein